jgi:hypothetical protein
MMNHIRSTDPNTLIVKLFTGFVVAFFALVGIGSLALVGYEAVLGLTINLLAGSLLTGTIFGAVGLVNAMHSATAINGTAAQTASQTALSLQPAIDQANLISRMNAETIAKLIDDMMKQKDRAQEAVITQSVAAPLAAVVAQKVSEDAIADAVASVQNMPVVALTPDVAALATDEGAIAHNMERAEPAMLDKQQADKQTKKGKP